MNLVSMSLNFNMPMILYHRQNFAPNPSTVALFDGGVFSQIGHDISYWSCDIGIL